jgi:hypothetical protein
MRPKTSDSLKSLVWIFVLVAAVGLFLVWIECLGSSADPKPTPEWLDIASVLVSVATLVSIIFAVLTYIEGNVLRNTAKEARAAVVEEEARAKREIIGLNQVYYECAIAGLAAQREVLMCSPANPAFTEALNALRDAEISIEIALGNYTSLCRAMEVAFKYRPNTTTLQRLKMRYAASRWDCRGMVPGRPLSWMPKQF